MLRELFPEVKLQAEDLLLLEAFQIAYLPDRLARKEFATLLREYPVVQRFLIRKNSSISSFLISLLKENTPVTDSWQIREQCQKALWEIGDLIIYNKYPELFDVKAPAHWDIEEITSICPLEEKIVADVGAGSGRIAFLTAPLAQTIFAVEPLSSFRSFMKEKAMKQQVDNLFVMDGTLDYIPLPNDSLDVLITSNAIGWNLDKELKEIERVVKPGGYAIHLLHSNLQQEDSLCNTLSPAPWNYLCTRKTEKETRKTRYYKSMPSSY